MNNDVEGMAERIVLHELGGRVIQRDDQSQPGMVDLVIETADRSRVAVEVTTLTPEESAKFHTACSQFGGPCDSLGRTWSVRFLRSTRIKKVAESLLALLGKLEAVGTSRVDVNNWTEDERHFVDRLRSLGVVAVSSVKGPGWILTVNRIIGAAAASGEILTAVATNILNDPKRDDNAPQTDGDQPRTPPPVHRRKRSRRPRTHCGRPSTTTALPAIDTSISQ